MDQGWRVEQVEWKVEQAEWRVDQSGKKWNIFPTLLGKDLSMSDDSMTDEHRLLPKRPNPVSLIVFSERLSSQW